MKEKFEEDYRFFTDLDVMNTMMENKFHKQKIQNDDLAYSLSQKDMDSVNPMGPIAQV